ncbi:MAG: hemin uptake protein HemP [Proteobacteria bacterium]|nr:hemin uptake protein HemP [Pseudomonadota bacterium]
MTFDKPSDTPETLLPFKQGNTGHRVIASSVLFAGKTELRILHGGVEYLLRITKENKLILTK